MEYRISVTNQRFTLCHCYALSNENGKFWNFGWLDGGGHWMSWFFICSLACSFISCSCWLLYSWSYLRWSMAGNSCQYVCLTGKLRVRWHARLHIVMTSPLTPVCQHPMCFWLDKINPHVIIFTFSGWCFGWNVLYVSPDLVLNVSITVTPATRDHPKCHQKAVFQKRWSRIRGTL